MDSSANPAVPRSQWNTQDGPGQLSPPAYPPALLTPAPSAVWSRLGRGRAAVATSMELSRHTGAQRGAAAPGVSASTVDRGFATFGHGRDLIGAREMVPGRVVVSLPYDATWSTQATSSSSVDNQQFLRDSRGISSMPTVPEASVQPGRVVDVSSWGQGLGARPHDLTGVAYDTLVRDLAREGALSDSGRPGDQWLDPVLRLPSFPTATPYLPPEVGGQPTSDGPVGATMERKRVSAMKPPRFDGSASVDTFLIQFATCADYNGWTDEDKAANLKCNLSGPVGQLLWEAGDAAQLSYPQLVSKLRARYGSEGQKELFVAQLRARRRRSNESLAELYRDVKRLMSLAYSNSYGSELHEEISKSHFIAALGDRNLELKLREREPKDLDSTFALAVRLEAYQSAADDDHRDARDRHQARNRDGDRLAGRVAAVEQTVGQMQSLMDKNDELRRELGRERAERDKATKELDRLKLLASQRSVKSETEASEQLGSAAGARRSDYSQQERRSATKEQLKCYRCGGFGHFARACASNQNRSPKDEDKGTENIRGVYHSGRSRDVYLRMIILGQSVDCLLDSGSEVTLLPSRVVGRIRADTDTGHLLAANHTRIKILGETTVVADAKGYKFRLSGYVCDQVAGVILGADFLTQNGALWDFSRSEIVLDGRRFHLRTRPRLGYVRRIIVDGDEVIPRRSEALLSAHIEFGSFPVGCSGETTRWYTETSEPVSGLYVSRIVLPDRSYDLPIRVMNVTTSDIKLPAGAKLADLQFAEAQDFSEPADCPENDGLKRQLIEELVGGIDESLTEDCRSQLRELLLKYSEAFSTGETDLGRTSLARHAIDTGDARPVRQPLRRHPPAHNEAIRDHVKMMLQQKVIQKAQSPWASNLVLVRKKDGTLRCCVDYRQLNKVTRQDAYPLPRIDVCLDTMSGARWFSTFDFRSSYHQVETEPNDTDNTAFICREGQFKFVTMPFGLSCAPSTFQRLIDVMLAGLAYEICLAYLDDIIVFSSSVEEHLERLGKVLERILASGLKIKVSKTHLFRKSVDFLGHVVSDRGIEPQQEKIATVASWPEPGNIHELKAFIGLCTYYRRFVLGFSGVAAPLYGLMKKGVSFVWNDICQESFDKLKQALISAPILGIPNDTDTFVLDTDASNEQIGAVLSQIQDGQEVVIAYGSRRLSQAERNYCITRKELLALVFFVKRYRQYILGRHFIIRTDHAALQWLRRVSEPIGQQARWLEQLEEYDFDVVHRAGAKHGNADAMTRKPCDRPRCCRRDQNAVSSSVDPENWVVAVIRTDDDTVELPSIHSHWDADVLAQAQTTDPDIGPIRELKLLAKDDERPSWDAVAGLSAVAKSLWWQWCRLRMLRGILVRRFEEADGTREWMQVILPVSLRSEFIELTHGGSTGGHLGLRKTKCQVQQRAYWPGWSETVKEVLQRCAPCARYHRGKAPRQTELKPFVAGEPWEVISIDITGPHPKSRRGFQYILTVVDHFSKWAEAIPIRNHTAATVASVLFDNIFCRMGMPLRCLSDQGAEFESELFQQLSVLSGIHKIRTTPYKPSTNGAVERFHRTLNSMLAKVIDRSQRDWCEHLPSVMMAYRASSHESTNFSPNRVMFGRENKLPVDLVLGDLREDPRGVSVDDYVLSLRERQRDDFILVREHLGKAAQGRKAMYDDNVRVKSFVVGQLVWYFYPRRRKGLSPKWQNMYDGPYRVVRLLDSHTVVIQRSPKSKIQIVHRDKLKPCLTDTADDTEEAAGPLELREPDPTSTPVAMRPRRTARPPAHLRDFYCDAIVESMANRAVRDGMTSNVCCRVCLSRFRERHGLRQHLERFASQPDHADYAARELAAWRSRGRPSTRSRSPDRRRGPSPIPLVAGVRRPSPQPGTADRFLLRGRCLAEAVMAAEDPEVALGSRAFVRRYWGGLSAAQERAALAGVVAGLYVGIRAAREQRGELLFRHLQGVFGDSPSSTLGAPPRTPAGDRETPPRRLRSVVAPPHPLGADRARTYTRSPRKEVRCRKTAAADGRRRSRSPRERTRVSIAPPRPPSAARGRRPSRSPSPQTVSLAIPRHGRAGSGQSPSSPIPSTTSGRRRRRSPRDEVRRAMPTPSTAGCQGVEASSPARSPTAIPATTTPSPASATHSSVSPECRRRRVAPRDEVLAATMAPPSPWLLGDPTTSSNTPASESEPTLDQRICEILGVDTLEPFLPLSETDLARFSPLQGRRDC